MRRYQAGFWLILALTMLILAGGLYLTARTMENITGKPVQTLVGFRSDGSRLELELLGKSYTVDKELLQIERLQAQAGTWIEAVTFRINSLFNKGTELLRSFVPGSGWPFFMRIYVDNTGLFG